MTRLIPCLLVTAVGYLPLAAEASFQDWYGLLTGSWTSPSFPADVSTAFAYKNLGCSEVRVTMDGRELDRLSADRGNEELWEGFPLLIKQKWVSDKHLRVTVWLTTSADVIDSAMAFVQEDDIRLYYSVRVHKWEGPAPPIACLFTHRLIYDFENIDRKQYKVNVEYWSWEMFYLKLALALALVLLFWFHRRWARKQRSLSSTPKT